MGKRNKNYEEANEMSEVMENGAVELENEMAATPVDTDVPQDANADAGKEEDNRKWYSLDGQEVSKSAFIREQFAKANKSRKQIAEEYNIPYRTVYGATVNMENEAEPTSRGRGVTFSKINVTEDGKVVFVKDGIVTIDGEAQPEGTAVPETIEVDRNTWIKDQVAAGKNRGDIAKILDLSYGVIYGLTKEAEGTRQKYEVVDLDSGETISRSEYIRRRVAAGVSKSEIAKELNVEYSVVWQATKKMKTVEEKFVDAVKNFEKFMDVVENPEALTQALALLNTVKIKAEEADKVTETEGTPAE